MPVPGGGAVVGVVTGLAGEAACLDAKRTRVACAGADPMRARAQAERLVAAGCGGLVSFGLAGGLDPTLPSGSLVVATQVVGPSGAAYPSDPAWRKRLVAAIGESRPVAVGAVAGSTTGVGSAEAKRALFARTGAVAVDMESLAVAEVAASRAVPLLVVRAIADPATRRVPAWLDGAIDPLGRPRLAAILAGLVAHPGDVGALCRLGFDARRGMATLRRVAALAGPLFAFDA